MAAFVIDSSLATSWCFPDEGTEYTNGVLRLLAGPIEVVAPRLWAYEIRNSVLVGVRRKRITLAEAEDFLESLRSLPIRLSDPVSYDAAYLDLAIRERTAIASLDRELLNAAAQVGVPVFELPSERRV